jgi:tRNA threonylcarbamoyladenosine biosynthesis protein TsaB
VTTHPISRPPSPSLLVDASGPLVQTALWADGHWESWRASRDEAGKSIFTGVESILKEHGSLDHWQGILFCEGPGSMLGIRIAAMAIRGWQGLAARPLPVFGYNSLLLLARILLARNVQPPFHILSDARRARWNLLSVSAAGEISSPRRVEKEELPALQGRFFRMEETVRNSPPVTAEMISYDLHEYAHLFLDEGLLRCSDSPEVFVQEAPDYKKWTAQRHHRSL